MGVRVPPSANQFCKPNQLSNLRRVPKLSLGALALYRHQRRLVSKILLDHDAFHGVGFSRRFGVGNARIIQI